MSSVWWSRDSAHIGWRVCRRLGSIQRANWHSLAAAFSACLVRWRSSGGAFRSQPAGPRPRSGPIDAICALTARRVVSKLLLARPRPSRPPPAFLEVLLICFVDRAVEVDSGRHRGYLLLHVASSDWRTISRHASELRLHARIGNTICPSPQQSGQLLRADDDIATPRDPKLGTVDTDIGEQPLPPDECGTSRQTLAALSGGPGRRRRACWAESLGGIARFTLRLPAVLRRADALLEVVSPFEVPP